MFFLIHATNKANGFGSERIRAHSFLQVFGSACFFINLNHTYE